MTKFIRVHEAELLKALAGDLDYTQYVLGIPRNNLNPFTRWLGNTTIDIVPRDGYSYLKPVRRYYDRLDLKDCYLDSGVKDLHVTKDDWLYPLLPEVSKELNLKLTEEDLYNTSPKVQDGLGVYHLLARPESYRYRGRTTFTVHSKPVSLVLYGVSIDPGLPVKLILKPTIE